MRAGPRRAATRRSRWERTVSKHRRSPDGDKERRPERRKAPKLTDEERRDAEDAVHDVVEDEGFEVLDLKLAGDRTIRLTLDGKILEPEVQKFDSEDELEKFCFGDEDDDFDDDDDD